MRKCRQSFVAIRAAVGVGGDIPLSPESKVVLRLAEEEEDRSLSKKIRTEHLLLGL
jgi:hypothetical protein